VERCGCKADMEQIEVQQLLAEEATRLEALFDVCEKYGQKFVRTKPGDCILPNAYEKCKDRIKNFALCDGDVCLLTYPKCGTTWTQELLTLVKNDFDFEKTQATPMPQRGVMIDLLFLLDALRKDGFPVDGMFEKMEKLPSPRMVVSHLPPTLLPDDLFHKCKVIMCFRNPKDAVVSKYNFEKMVKVFGYVGDLQSYFDLFMDDLGVYGSYFEYVKTSWEKRDNPNVCVLFFEDMKKDLGKSVRKVADFLGKTYTEDQIEKSVDFLSFKSMKERGSGDTFQTMLKKSDSDGHFMRKGEAGDWKNSFTDEMTKRMNDAIEKHLKPIGLEFQYE